MNVVKNSFICTNCKRSFDKLTNGMCDMCYEASTDSDLDGICVSETPIYHPTQEEIDAVPEVVICDSDKKVERKPWPAEMYAGAKKLPLGTRRNNV